MSSYSVNGNFEVLPKIGSKGTYVLRVPFDSQINPQLEYTCIDIALLNKLEAQGYDALTLVYLANNLTKQDYLNDCLENRCLVTLQSATGNILKVPSNYIVATPDANGIRYNVLALGVNLGALPDTLDVTALLNAVSDITKAYVGITPEIKLMALAPSYLINAELHDRIQSTRQTMLTQTEPIILQNARLKQENDSLRQQIQMLLDEFAS